MLFSYLLPPLPCIASDFRDGRFPPTLFFLDLITTARSTLPRLVRFLIGVTGGQTILVEERIEELLC